MSVFDKIISLTRQLYPTGRAFKLPVGGTIERLHKALALSEERSYNDAVSILNSALPDNSEFTEEDAELWEKRLGLITNPLVSLSNRKLAIIRKMNHPGNVPARQNFRFMEGQLRAAGFNVYVHENRFPSGGGFVTQDPLTLSGSGGADRQHGDFQHGDIQHGAAFNNIIVNHIDQELDVIFDIGNNLRSTFFIGGNPVGTSASVPLARKEEFRQLILKIKPAQMVGYLFINYT